MVAALVLLVAGMIPIVGAGFPAWVHTVFGTSAVVVTTILAIILNLILPKEENQQADE